MLKTGVRVGWWVGMMVWLKVNSLGCQRVDSMDDKMAWNWVAL
jgi:hypothetical protein